MRINFVNGILMSGNSHQPLAGVFLSSKNLLFASAFHFYLILVPGFVHWHILLGDRILIWFSHLSKTKFSVTYAKSFMIKTLRRQKCSNPNICFYFNRIYPIITELSHSVRKSMGLCAHILRLLLLYYEFSSVNKWHRKYCLTVN